MNLTEQDLKENEVIECPFCHYGLVKPDYFPGSKDYGKVTEHQLCNGTGKIPKTLLERIK